MRAAVVHDAFTQLGGGERVAGRLADALDAPLYAAAIRGETAAAAVPDRAIDTTFVQALVDRGVPLRALAPLLPVAFARLDPGPVDVVVSSSSAFAHHVGVPGGAVHVCYCHTPPRFLWEPADYFVGHGTTRALLAPGLAALRRLDLVAARRVDLYIANSRHIAAKIRRTYGREAVVVHPPIDAAAFRPTTERSGRFVVVSRLRDQKRIDLAVRAANLRGLPLDVIGEGPELERLRALAGPTVRFLGRRSDEEARTRMALSAGVVVPAVQDFGLTLVEAQASGRLPIAFGEGGALEIVEDGRTGVLFREQTPDGVADAMVRALSTPLDAAVLVASARRFDVAAFRSGIRAAVAGALVTGAARRRVHGRGVVAPTGAALALLATDRPGPVDGR